MESFVPRAYVVDEFEILPPEKILDHIARPDFDLRRTVALEKQPDFAGADEAGVLQWKVEDFSRAPHMVEMRVTTDRPGILVLQDFNGVNWRALIDSEEAEILQANYLMRGVVVPEGEHRVVFTYHPPVWGFAVTLFSWVAVIALAVYSLASRALAALKGARADML